MRLFDEEETKKKKEKSNKITKYIMIATILIIILIIATSIAIIYISSHPNTITLYLDGRRNDELLSLLKVEIDYDGSLVVEAPIVDIASYFGYTANLGNYVVSTESEDSCYIRNEYEVTIFNVDSNILQKKNLEENTDETEYLSLSEDVYKENGKLYTNLEGIQKAFNLSIGYNEQTKRITINSLDTYIATATERAVSYGYEALDERYVNQRALVNNMMVVISEDGYYGVVNYSTGDVILGVQYDDIKYMQEELAFLITTNNYVGIIGSDRTEKISPQYQSLTMIDSERNLFLAQRNDLYGVIDIDENVIIYVEYDEIGVDISNFTQNGLDSGYILLDRVIPVMQGDKWGFFDVEGNQITELEYDNIGCTSRTNRVATYNLLEVPEYSVIVVGKNDKYTFMNTSGEEVLACIFDEIYMKLSSGKNEYYLYRETEGEQNITEFVQQR